MGKRWHLGACVLLGVGFLAFGPGVWEVPPENVFDFSRVEKEEMPRGAKYVFMGGVYARGFRYRPLHVHLRFPEGQQRFRYGEPTVFEVVLENVGEHVVTVPWSVDWAGVGLSPERPTELPPGSGMRRSAFAPDRTSIRKARWGIVWYWMSCGVRRGCPGA